jgi:hypothetical protein
MAHFYATIKGNRGLASRMGTKFGGMVSYTASWEGSVRVGLYHDEKTGQDLVRVELKPWRGEGTSRVLYEGPVGGEEAREFRHCDECKVPTVQTPSRCLGRMVKGRRAGHWYPGPRPSGEVPVK